MAPECRRWIKNYPTNAAWTSQKEKEETIHKLMAYLFFMILQTFI